MRLGAAVALFASIAQPVIADFDAASYPAYETCALCHGLFGQSRLDKFPHLAGQKPAYIQGQLDAFLNGTRTNDGGQMSSIVTELKPEDFAVVVAWFAEQEPPAPSTVAPNSAGLERAQSAGCLECHNANSEAHVPLLSAQHAGYLAKQMRDFQAGLRNHTAFSEMHHSLLAGMEHEIDSIAGYFASSERPE